MLSKGKSLVTVLSPAPVTVYNVVVKYCDQNQLREGRAHFSSQLQKMIVYHQKKSGQELKAGSWRQELKQKLRRKDAFSWFAQPALSRLPGPAAQVWHHLQWEAPSHITRQSRECSTGWATCQSYRDIFSVTLPSSQVTLMCVKVTQIWARQSLSSVIFWLSLLGIFWDFIVY